MKLIAILKFLKLGNTIEVFREKSRKFKVEILES